MASPPSSTPSSTPSPPPSNQAPSYFSRLNPIPTLPAYTGPHQVGTVDVELPVSSLHSPSPAPENTSHIHTVQFRVYYPTDPDAKGKRITWLPAPQRAHVAALVKFMGMRPLVAEALSFLPRHLHYASIPVIKNAKLLEPESSNARWPTIVFSHGLAGNRTTYSHVAGSLASHGAVVICPEHRDGSALISFIRDPAAQDAFFTRNTRQPVAFRQIPHVAKPEAWDPRNEQLRIRTWELGLIHEAILGLDEGVPIQNLNASTPTPALEQFAGKLHVQDPGAIIWAGHSFGAATMVQLLKSTYYAGLPQVAAMERPLFRPAADSRLQRQITEKSITILLDMWCMPLLSPATRVLYNLPLPVYADVPTAPGGTALLAIESESFFKWEEHLHTKAKILSAVPSAPVVTAASFERPSGIRLAEPNFFCVEQSAHLSQSDFGVLFPWLTGRIFGVKDPLHPLRLNMRAMLQLLRDNGVAIARTATGDLIDGAYTDKLDPKATGAVLDGTNNDKAIFDRSSENPIDRWKWVDIVGMGAKAVDQDAAGEPTGTDASKRLEEGEQKMEVEMEPGLAAASLPERPVATA